MKYPAIFQGSDAVVVTKNDLLAHTNFHVDASRPTGAAGPRGRRSSRSRPLRGEGIAELARWLGRMKDEGGRMNAKCKM